MGNHRDIKKKKRDNKKDEKMVVCRSMVLVEYPLKLAKGLLQKKKMWVIGPLFHLHSVNLCSRTILIDLECLSVGDSEFLDGRKFGA